MKLHVGCGSVYLDGWMNVDLHGPKSFLAKDRPDLVQKWKTTDAAYYAKHPDKTIDTLRQGPLDQEYVCDYFATFSNLPCAAGKAEEVLARHSFEHLSIAEARHALDQIEGVLKENGILRLDVPDHDETLRLYRETGDEFYVRHLLGPRRNDYGFHMMSFTRDRLRRLVEEHGFVFLEEEPNIHIYPAFCLRFVRPGGRAPNEYALPSYVIPEDWNVADIGPGGYPFLEASTYIDIDQAKLDAVPDARTKRLMRADLMSGLPEIRDKEFDYVWCSHVFEHLADPLKGAQTLSRIGKRGTVVLPSAIKEALFNFEEVDHEWLVLPGPSGGPPVFVRQNPAYMANVRDVDVQKITSRLFRTGPNRIDPEQRHLRQWFYRHEPDLDVIVHWENELKLEVIG